jgi:hypothetical protein
MLEYLLPTENSAKFLKMAKIERPDPATLIARMVISIYPPMRSHPTILIVVEVNGFEPMASCVQGRRSPN